MEKKKITRPLAKETIAVVTGTKNNKTEDVKEFAYSLYEKRGYIKGNELQDWFEAEKAINKR